MQYYSIDIQQDPACNANININIRPICGGRARIRATSQSSSTVDACARSACCYSSRIPSHSGCTPSRNRRKVESDLSPIPGAQPAPCAHASDMRVCAWLRAERAGTRAGGYAGSRSTSSGNPLCCGQRRQLHATSGTLRALKHSIRSRIPYT